MLKKLTAIGLLALAGGMISPHHAIAQDYPEEMVRVPIEDMPFADFFPGISVYPMYGDFSDPHPHATIIRNNPAITEEAEHFHTHGYWAVVVAGRLQHWESDEPDRGPILTAGSTWFQPGGVPHSDKCLGPEECVTLIIWKEAGDFIPVE